MQPIDLAVTVNQAAAEARSRVLGDLEPRLRAHGFTGHPKTDVPAPATVVSGLACAS